MHYSERAERVRAEITHTHTHAHSALAFLSVTRHTDSASVLLPCDSRQVTLRLTLTPPIPKLLCSVRAEVPTHVPKRTSRPPIVPKRAREGGREREREREREKKRALNWPASDSYFAGPGRTVRTTGLVSFGSYRARVCVCVCVCVCHFQCVCVCVVRIACKFIK